MPRETEPSAVLDSPAPSALPVRTVYAACLLVGLGGLFNGVTATWGPGRSVPAVHGNVGESAPYASGRWPQAYNLGPFARARLCRPGTDPSDPTGNTLYIFSNRAGAIGGADVFVTTRTCQ